MDKNKKTILIDVSLHEELKELSEETHLPIRYLIEMSVERFIKNYAEKIKRAFSEN